MNAPQAGMLWPYVKDMRAYVCPATPILPDSSYAMNGYLAGPDWESVGAAPKGPRVNLSQFRRLAETFVFIEQLNSSLTDLRQAAVVTPFEAPHIIPNQPDSRAVQWGLLPGINHSVGTTNGTTISFGDGHAIFWQYSFAVYNGYNFIPNAGRSNGPDAIDASADGRQLANWAGRIDGK